MRFSSFPFVTMSLLFSASPAFTQPPVNDRWNGATALPQTQGNFNQGTPLTLTWGFMALGTGINDAAFNGIGTAVNAPNNLQTRLNTIYGSQAVWQPIVASVFDRWAAVSGLSYQFEANDDGAAIGTSFPNGQLGMRADIRIGGKNLDGNSGVLAYNYFPNIGEMVIDTNDTFYNSTANASRALRNVMTHEHGHGIGMNHVESTNGAFLMEPFINNNFDGPQYHDILAAHHMYGDAREKSNAGLGNDTVARASPLGIVNGGPVSIGNSARTLVVAATFADNVSIDSATDTDFYSFTLSSSGKVTILLEALGFTYNVTAQGAGGNVPFDTKSRSDLILTLLAADCVTVLATINATGLGGNEFLTSDLLPAGTYFVRITGVDNIDSIVLDTQFYAITIDMVPVPEPASMLAFGAVAGVGFRRLRRRLSSAATRV